MQGCESNTYCAAWLFFLSLKCVKRLRAAHNFSWDHCVDWADCYASFAYCSAFHSMCSDSCVGCLAAICAVIQLKVNEPRSWGMRAC